MSEPQTYNSSSMPWSTQQALLEAVRESGLRPALISAEGLSAEGYYELQPDSVTGYPARVDGGLVKTLRPWPEGAWERIEPILRGEQ